MKSILILAASVFLFSNVLVASDTVNENKVESDTSTNPLTGTKTYTTKKHYKKKNVDGSNATTDVTEKTKVKRDGETSKTVDIEKSNEN